jgi:hypothetical protein
VPRVCWLPAGTPGRHAVGGECEGLGEAAAAIGEGHAERAHFAVGTLGSAQEDLALAGGDILAGTIGRVRAMADGGAESVFSPIVLGPEGGLVAKCQRKQRAPAGFGRRLLHY